MTQDINTMHARTVTFIVMLLAALLPAQPAASQQAPIFFIMTSFDAMYAAEHGGSPEPARGGNVSIRPIAGLTSQIAGDVRLTLLGGASATRYAVTPASNADSLFAMASFAKTIGGYRFNAALLAADARDPTFATGVAKIYDTTLSVSRPFTLAALDGWSLTPQLKAVRRLADAEVVERWNLGASVEMARPAFGGVFTIGSGYDWLDYSVDGRHDDKLSISSSWLIDLNANVQVGVRSEASFTKSNVPGMSVNSFEIGPTLKVMFAK